MENEKYKRIEFTGFKFYDDMTGFECMVKADDHLHSDVIYFRFNKPIGEISNNLVFASLMTLVGKDWYENAYFDLSVSKWAYERAIQVSKSKITVKDTDYSEDEKKRQFYTGMSLNLSGGVDSNSLYYLLKRGEVDFVSIHTNFGDEYHRDDIVAENRADLVMTTNIRAKDTKYVADRKTWRFMGIASILTVDHFQTKTILFGQLNQWDRFLRVLMNDKKIRIRRPNNEFFSIVDCDISGIHFLTEFQTSIILLDNVHDKEFLSKIEDASATTGHLGKFFRKQMFLLAAQKFLGMKPIDYSKYKFMDENDKFNKRFVNEVNSMTIKDKNLVLVLGLKYLDYVPNVVHNPLFDKVTDFTFIENVYLNDIPQVYLKSPKLLDYLKSIFKVEE